MMLSGFPRPSLVALLGGWTAVLFAFTAPLSAQPAPPGGRSVEGAEQIGGELEFDRELAKSGQALLNKYCYRCHGEGAALYPGLDMGNRKLLLRPADADEAPFIVPGKPRESRIWEQIEYQAMPPEDQDQPTAEERQIIRRWIESGAFFPPPERVEREFLGDATLLNMIFTDLSQMREDERSFVRYFSLAHLWNDPNVTDQQLRIYGAAASKLMNSLSYQPRIAPPRKVDPQGRLLAIDLRDYGWDRGHKWQRVLQAYPYGMQLATLEAQRVYDLTGCGMPYLRADWFVHHASRPPLYHDLLEIPEHSDSLERMLGVDVASNYRRGRLWRAGFAKSGVSRQNRLVERHDARFGAYWKSYDFGDNVGASNLFQFPLGPEIQGVQIRRAFEHDGGELIWNLPNGLQGYMLITDEGKRIDEGPINIVSDGKKFSGSPAIVNGVSCMGCHSRGMIRFADEIRPVYALKAAQRTGQEVLRLYPPKEEMDVMVRQDERRFTSAATQACGPWLLEEGATEIDFSKLPEPVTRASMDYDIPLTAEDMAFELGLPRDTEKARQLGLIGAEELATAIRVSDYLGTQLNLAPVATGGALPRDVWEQSFQRAARELKLGAPYSEF